MASLDGREERSVPKGLPPEKRIRVLFLDHERRLSGGQQELVDLVAAMDRRLVEVHVALPGSGPLDSALRLNGVTVHHLSMSRGLRRASRWSLDRRPLEAIRHTVALAAASFRFARLIRRVRPDLVHTNSMKAHFIAVVPTLALRVPLVWHIRDIVPDGWLSSLLRATGRISATRIICLSHVAAEQFAGSRAWPLVRVVYDGVDLGRFRNPTDPAWRARLAGDHGGVVVGIVGQIAHWKGQDVFLDAAALVKSRCASARFAIIGACLFSENHDAFDRSIHQRSEALGLSDLVTWTGWVDDVPGAIGALDILVHASRLPEPFGRVLVEGMAAGKPVITTTIGAGPEIVPPDAGRLVAADDPPALAEAMISLIEDEEERLRCGRAGIDAARGFDIAETARAVLDVYSEIQ